MQSLFGYYDEEIWTQAQTPTEMLFSDPYTLTGIGYSFLISKSEKYSSWSVSTYNIMNFLATVGGLIFATYILILALYFTILPVFSAAAMSVTTLVYREPANETTSVEKLVSTFVNTLDKKPQTVQERLGQAIRQRVVNAIKA